MRCEIVIVMDKCKAMDIYVLDVQNYGRSTFVGLSPRI
jgi:hypothetical protein